jgi:hypothetical protein
MATKKIVALVTLHVPAKDFKPFKFDAFSNCLGGSYKIVEVAPGRVIDLPEAEADDLIAAKKAEAYEDPKVEAEEPEAATAP